MRLMSLTSTVLAEKLTLVHLFAHFSFRFTCHILYLNLYLTYPKLKSSCVSLSLFSVSGESHEVFIQRVPPLAPAGPVTHGGREGELISPYIPEAAAAAAVAAAPCTYHATPRKAHPSSAMPLSCKLQRFSFTPCVQTCNK